MNISILDRKKLIPVITVILFFSILLSAGLFTYKDYGVSSDEPINYTRGQVNYTAFRGGSLEDFSNTCAKLKNVCFYPPLYNMLTYRLVPQGDSQIIFERLHLINFLFFAGAVFVFFLIGKKIFKNWIIALLGCLFLALSPRIFGHAFYNPKDIPFMDAYIVAIYTMLWFLEKKNVFTAILHGAAIAVACGIRTPGLIILPITVAFYVFDLFLAKRQWADYRKGLALLLLSSGVAGLLLYWFTPFLYGDPVSNFILTFNLMKQYSWNQSQLYLGVDIKNRIPWHYSLVWFAVSSPPFYVALFGLGSLTLILRSLKSRLREHFLALRHLYLVAACGVLPIVAVILMKSVIYSDNRQMYFCYPALLLISLYGFKVLIEELSKINLHWRAWASVILMLGLAYPAYFLVRYHTREDVFFNFLAGPRMSVIATRFTMDRWGLAGKNALEYILATDSDKQIDVIAGSGIVQSLKILPESQRTRLKIKGTGAGEYFITHNLNDTEDTVQGQLIYATKVFDVDIIRIFRLDN
jgi:hypothetical protein